MSEATESSARSALSAAGWAEVSDQLLSGLAADIQGRVASLEGLVQLIGMEGRNTAVGEFVTAETDRLGEAVGLLTLLRRSRTPEEPVAIEPGVHMPRLLDLIGSVRELERVKFVLDVDSGASAFAAADLHTRLQLCALSAVGWEALARDRRVEIEVRESASTVLTHMVVPGAYLRGVERPPPAACPSGIEALASLLGGESSWVARLECARLKLALPTAP